MMLRALNSLTQNRAVNPTLLQPSGIPSASARQNYYTAQPMQDVLSLSPRFGSCHTHPEARLKVSINLDALRGARRNANGDYIIDAAFDKDLPENAEALSGIEAIAKAGNLVVDLPPPESQVTLSQQELDALLKVTEDREDGEELDLDLATRADHPKDGNGGEIDGVLALPLKVDQATLERLREEEDERYYGHSANR